MTLKKFTDHSLGFIGDALPYLGTININQPN